MNFSVLHILFTKMTACFFGHFPYYAILGIYCITEVLSSRSYVPRLIVFSSLKADLKIAKVGAIQII